MAGSVNLRFLILFVLIVPCLAGKVKDGPRFLQLFAHENRVPPSNTVIVSASPDGNFSGIYHFGMIRTVSNILKAGRSNESKILGSQVGIVVVGLDTIPVYISFTYFLSHNATHQGTIAVQGFIDGSSTADGVFAVIGGTGHFLSVTGVDRSAYDSGGRGNPSNVINVHNITLHYRPWA